MAYYSSVWTRAPSATAPSMTGLIVACCTLASMRSTTWPPRWIRPRTGGLSFAAVPRPGAPSSLRRRPSRPLWPRPLAGPCARPPRDLVDLHLALQLHLRGLGHEPAAQPLRHGLRVGRTQAQFQRDLSVRQVQAHEVEAQHPHRSEEHTSELQSRQYLVCRLLLEKKKY